MKASKAQVHAALNQAVENGYTEIVQWPVADIADDLLAFNGDCSDMNADELAPMITEWLKARKGAGE